MRYILVEDTRKLIHHVLAAVQALLPSELYKTHHMTFIKDVTTNNEVLMITDDIEITVIYSRSKLNSLMFYALCLDNNGCSKL